MLSFTFQEDQNQALESFAFLMNVKRLVDAEEYILAPGYQIRVALSAAGLGGGKDLVWDTGRVTSEECTLRAYEGQPLRSGQRYHWQVRIWDGGGKPSEWSAPAWFEMGLLDAADWSAGLDLVKTALDRKIVPPVTVNATVDPPVGNALPAASRACSVSVAVPPDTTVPVDTETCDVAVEMVPGVTVTVGSGADATGAALIVAPIVVAVPAITPVNVAV